jgi:ankyrin repeat protein
MRKLATSAVLALLSFMLVGCGSIPSPPLAAAASAGDREQVSSLLRAGADPNARGEMGFTPLISAAREGRIEVIRTLIENGADPDLRGGVNDWTPLMHAVHKNQLGSVETLLDRGAGVNAAGPHGISALMMAAGYGQTEIVRLLLRRGADSRARGVHGETALSLAVSGVPDIDRFTVARCQTETVKALLDAAPELAGEVNSWARTVARLGSCSEVLRLLKERESAANHRTHH